jgi:hypothetical protein
LAVEADFTCCGTLVRAAADAGRFRTTKGENEVRNRLMNVHEACSAAKLAGPQLALSPAPAVWERPPGRTSQTLWRERRFKPLTAQ